MSLVTRCTACGTLFKVVSDQLKISDGWVRCGQCAHVFDAQSNLVSEIVPATATPALTPSPPRPRPSAPAPALREPMPLPASKRVSVEPLGVPASLAPAAPAPLMDPISDRITPEDLLDFKRSRSISLPAELEPAFPEPERAPDLREPERAPDLRESDFHFPPESFPPSNQMPDSQQFKPGRLRDSTDLSKDMGPSTSTWVSSDFASRADNAPASILPDSPSVMPVQAEAVTGTSPMPMPTPSFVAQAQRAARWRSPWMRLGLSMLALVLLAVLALQVALQEKDRMAALYPRSTPWLMQICQAMACRVQAYRHIESILVDASSFNKVNKTEASSEAKNPSYKLTVTLKNTGALPVALPHVELSLQDAQDQPVLRRVLSPADLGAIQTSLQPSADFAGNLTLQIDNTQLASARISGYRVLAFYP
jgi:predicted Zn finger-like uncharacterized protein